MTDEEIEFVTDFQKNFLEPMQTDLSSRKHRNWKDNPLSVTIEEIIKSFSILPESNGEFHLAYECRKDAVVASYSFNYPTDHLEHCLWEIFIHLELYHLKGNGLLPLDSKLAHFQQGIKKLFQIINSKEYGTFIP